MVMGSTGGVRALRQVPPGPRQKLAQLFLSSFLFFLPNDCFFLGE
jgi:hypothetical protein